MSTEVY